MIKLSNLYILLIMIRFTQKTSNRPSLVFLRVARRQPPCGSAFSPHRPASLLIPIHLPTSLFLKLFPAKLPVISPSWRMMIV